MKKNDEKSIVKIDTILWSTEHYNFIKRHALGQVSLEVYEEFSAEMSQKKDAILKQIETLSEKLSNPKKLINFACKLSANLSKSWELGDFYQKQQFQTTLFPEGLVYDSKNNNYRTPKVNEVIALIANESRSLENKKSRTSEKTSKSPAWYPADWIYRTLWMIFKQLEL